MTQPLKASQGSLYLQEAPGSAPEYLGCVDVDAIPDPRGAVTLLRCRDRDGNYQTVGEAQAVPDQPTTTVTAWVYPDADILDRISDQNCYANLFVTMRDCGKAGVFNNWVRADIMHHARLMNITGANMVMREATEAATRALEFTGWGVYHLRNSFNFARQGIAETVALNAIAFDNQVTCAGDCGDAIALGQIGFAGGDAPAGSPTDRADIWQTDDSGATWENVTGAPAHPFVAGQDIVAAALFDMDGTTRRWLVAREIVGGEALKVAYSDDSGATWTLVTVGSTVGEGTAGPKALFVLDRDNLWIATTDGAIYKSTDAGATWTEQAAAVIASGGAQLNALQFVDNLRGYAVGDTAIILKTLDGGVTWSVIDGPDGVSSNFTALAVFSQHRIEIGTAADGLYQTQDSGDHWSTKTFTGSVGTGTVKALVAVNDLVVWMLHSPLAGQGYVHRSIDGGHSFERLVTPPNAGLNDLIALGVNAAYTVGEAYSGSAFVAKVSS